jgi:hypothetical protein
VYWNTTLPTPAWDVGSASVSIGRNSGTSQTVGSVAIGFNAGAQGQNAIAIGSAAGQTNQGVNSIAIGSQAGTLNQVQNSIVLNALGTALNAGSTGFFVAPVRGLTGAAAVGATGACQYNPTTREISYNDSKTFVIDHPLDSDNKYLVHACLEGPETGVYYRGKGEIVNGTSVEVQLPAYVGALCTDMTVQITHIYDGAVKSFSASEVDTATNTFTVHGENGRFNWLVHGKRSDLTVEPNKDDVTILGDGPYKYTI